MTVEQILNLLEHTRDFTSKGKKIKISFEQYLESNGAEIMDVTNPYEAARFKIEGKTCVIYYKQSKGKFSYSDEEFVKPFHKDWKEGKEWVKKWGKPKEEDLELVKARSELDEILKTIKSSSDNYTIHDFLSIACDLSPFKTSKLKNMDEIEKTKVSIKQYRKIFLKEDL